MLTQRMSDRKVNLYERQWCVLELWLAHYHKKPIYAIGPTTAPLRRDRMGSRAKCGDPGDTATIDGHGLSFTSTSRPCRRYSVRIEALILGGVSEADDVM